MDAANTTDLPACASQDGAHPPIALTADAGAQTGTPVARGVITARIVFAAPADGGPSRWIVYGEHLITGVEIRRPDSDLYLLASRSTTERGKWQVTRFDSLGPTGHVARASLEDAIAWYAHGDRQWFNAVPTVHYTPGPAIPCTFTAADWPSPGVVRAGDSYHRTALPGTADLTLHGDALTVGLAWDSDSAAPYVTDVGDELTVDESDSIDAVIAAAWEAHEQLAREAA